MIRKVFTLPPTLPVSRVLATQLAQTAGRFSSRIMIENEQKIVNGKSLLGLLSLYDALDKPLQLIVEGPDEVEAAAAVMSFVGVEE